MSSIKIHLQKLEKGIIFQIVDQHVNFDEKNFLLESPKGHVNINFKKTAHPQMTFLSKIERNRHGEVRKKVTPFVYIDGKEIMNRKFEGDPEKITIYLRGNLKSRDNDIITIKFYDNEKRDKMYNILKESFKRLSQ
jgi:hypothetical protein